MTSRAQTPNVRRMATVAAVLVLLLGACGGSSDEDDAAPASPTETTTSDTNEATETDAAIRVLPPDEFAAFVEANPDAPFVNVHIPYEGHIDGTSDFVAFDEIAEWDGLPEDKDAPFVLYCRSGNMSATSSETLASLGYTDIVDLEGGMNAWTASGRELLKQSPPAE